MKTISSENSQHLLESISCGSIESFGDFYEMYRGFVFSIAYKILANKEEAEDICHDVFIEIAKNAHTYNQSRGSIEAWLAIKTRSRSVDLLRKKREIVLDEIERKKEQMEANKHISIEEKVMLKLDKELIGAALNKLPEPQRAALYGSYFEQFTHKELAAKLHKPLGTVKSLVRYGIRNLRKQLTDSRRVNSLRGDEKHDL